MTNTTMARRVALGGLSTLAAMALPTLAGATDVAARSDFAAIDAEAMFWMNPDTDFHDNAPAYAARHALADTKPATLAGVAARGSLFVRQHPAVHRTCLRRRAPTQR